MRCSPTTKGVQRWAKRGYVYALRTAALMEASREEGVLIGQGGLNGTVIRMGPSLLITEAETAEGIERLARAIDRVGARP